MITKNFKNLLAMALQSSSSTYSVIPIYDINGVKQYHDCKFSFPYSLTNTATLSSTQAGISVGTGATPSTEDDYNLENTITSDIAISVSLIRTGSDTNGNPFVQYNLSITNNSNDTITITEVGYKQNLKLAKCPYKAVGGNSSNDVVCLIDRTVLDTPVIVAAGDVGVILYKLQTNVYEEKTVSGIEIVSWEYGTDEQIAAMIDAARQGLIDLQEDASWVVGSVRKINIDSFSSPTVNHNSQSAWITISSFDSYEGCDNIMQFDFLYALAQNDRMNSSNTNVGGYGSTEMYNYTLPALVNALPEWLRTRLKTFSVKASAGNKSSEIEIVGNNKLALRSQYEIQGSNAQSFSGEGVYDFYKRTPYRAKNSKNWTRSPYSTQAARFVLLAANGGVESSEGNASVANGFSPFGCI